MRCNRTSYFFNMQERYQTKTPRKLEKHIGTTKGGGETTVAFQLFVVTWNLLKTCTKDKSSGPHPSDEGLRRHARHSRSAMAPTAEMTQIDPE